MKKIVILGCALFSVMAATAQQKEGKVIYERTVQVQISFGGMNEEMERMIPKTRTDKFELTFGNNQSLWRQAEQENEDDGNFTSADGGLQIRTFSAGSSDVVYTNFDKGIKVEKRELFDKVFIIDDSTRPMKWKMTGETKTILGHTCMKAEATQTRKRMQMNMDNGKMERKEINDTVLVVAWITSAIPVAAGPAEYQGQLPGLILEVDINKGQQTFKALSIDPKADIASIKEPTGKKRYTAAEFNKERDKMMSDMQQNGGGPGRVMRFGN